MGAPWPPAELPGLHVRMLARPPTADYRCGRCDWADSASGRGPGPHAALTERIRKHKQQCEGRRGEGDDLKAATQGRSSPPIPG